MNDHGGEILQTEYTLERSGYFQRRMQDIKKRMQTLKKQLDHLDYEYQSIKQKRLKINGLSDYEG